MTSVGIASGRSTTDDNRFRPGNRYRTRLYARATPMTAFRSAAMADVISVRRIAAHA